MMSDIRAMVIFNTANPLYGRYGMLIAKLLLFLQLPRTSVRGEITENNPGL